MTILNIWAYFQSAKWIKILGKILINPSLYLFPKWVLSKADPERGVVESFIYQLGNAHSNQLLLDAGAGNFRFKELLIQKGYTYESQDFDQVFEQSARGKHTYICDISEIPVGSNHFDIVICTQVLEHLASPSQVFEEFFRILKPDGTLILTTNFMFPIHGEPYDFFRFTSYGLKYLCEKSGFSNIEITPRGGFFSFWAKIIFDFPAIIKSWLFYGGVNPHGQRKIVIRFPLLAILLLPIIFVLDISCTILAFLTTLVDPLDRKSRFTLGYQLFAKRKY